LETLASIADRFVAPPPASAHLPGAPPAATLLRICPAHFGPAEGFSQGSSAFEEDRVTTPVFRVGSSRWIASLPGVLFRVSCDPLALLAATLPPILSRAFCQFPALSRALGEWGQGLLDCVILL